MNAVVVEVAAAARNEHQHIMIAAVAGNIVIFIGRGDAGHVENKRDVLARAVYEFTVFGFGSAHDYVVAAQKSYVWHIDSKPHGYGTFQHSKTILYPLYYKYGEKSIFFGKSDLGSRNRFARKLYAAAAGKRRVQ